MPTVGGYKYPIIKTPRGKIEVQPNLKAELTWNPNFQPKWQKTHSKAQMYLDSEILRLSQPYIPLLTGMLILSGILGSYIGEGRPKWIAPYAKAQYYRSKRPGSKTGPLRGPFWFERMKKQHGDKLIQNTKKKISEEAH